MKLGDQVKDTISGFTGIVTAVTYWLNGCTRINVEPEELKDGKTVGGHTFDIEQLEVIKEGKFKTQTNTSPERMAARMGGPKPAAVRR